METIQTGEIQLAKSEHDFRGLKKFLLACIGIIGSLGSVYFFDKLLETPSTEHIVGILMCGAIFGVTLVVQTLVISSRPTLTMMTVLETLIPVIIFFGRLPAWMPIGIGILLFLFFTFLGVMTGRKVSENSVDIELRHVSKAVLTKSITGLAILLAVLVYVHYFRWGTWSDDVGQKLLEESLRPTESIIRLYLPVFSFGLTVEDALRQFAESEVANIEKEGVKIIGKSASNIGSLPPLAKEKAIQEVLLQARVSLEKTFGPLKGDLRVDHALYNVLKSKVENLSEKSKDTFGIIVTVIAFWVLKGFGAIFSYVIRLLAAFVVKALVAADFLKKTWQSRNQETITL